MKWDGYVLTQKRHMSVERIDASRAAAIIAAAVIANTGPDKTYQIRSKRGRSFSVPT